MLDVQTNC